MRARTSRWHLVTSTVACVTAIVLLLPSSGRAQDAAASARPEGSTGQAIRELTAALAAERRRMADLQAEMARRSAALADISARLDALGASTRVEQPVPPQADIRGRTGEVRPATSAEAAPRFDFYGETRVRLDNLRQDYPGCPACPDRTRGRLRLRFGAEGRLAPGLRAVVGFGVGELNDPNTTYQSLGGNWGRKVATWDRGYLSYRPTGASWMELTAGKFPYTWLRSSMTFDVDFFPEGLSERFSFDRPRAVLLKNVTLQGLQLVINEQAGGPDTVIIGGQASVSVHPVHRLTTVFAATEMDIRRPEHLLRAQLAGLDVGTRNTNATLLDGAQSLYASGFRYVNVIVENTIQTPWEAMPIVAAVEYQHNARAVSSRDTGTSLRLDAGRLQRTGDWQFAWHVFRVEQDAIVAALGESDWRAPSNVLQHRFAVNRMLHPNVQAAFTWYRGRTLDRSLPGAVLAAELPSGLRDPWASRMYFDVLYRF